MKALSLKQPWAELIVSGKKTIEIRNWNTRFRGEFLVHASKNPNKERCEEFSLKDLPTGCIVGKATLTEVNSISPKNNSNPIPKSISPRVAGILKQRAFS